MTKRIITLLWLILTIPLCRAQQFSAAGDPNGSPFVFTPPASTGLDKVFVYQNSSQAVLTFSTSSPDDWKWYRYEQNPDHATALQLSDIQKSASGISASNIDPDYGYFVESTAGLRHYCFVVQYHPAQVSGISFTTDGDVCNILTLQVNAQVEPLAYYTTGGLKRTISREFSLTWNSMQWNSQNKKYETLAMNATASNLTLPWSVTAPLCDTYFTLTGDQIAKFFGNSLSYISAEYKAIAVETNPVAVPELRDYKNEKDRTEAGEYTDGQMPTGSAPLTLDFTCNPSPASRFYEWFIYDNEAGTGNYKRYSDENLTHTFLQSGKFMVKLFVSNGSCTDSASFTPKITESMLDCPNFFTPRTSPGENDEFRVVYKSLVRFKGTIINRWGTVLFEWNDPGKGWDGTFKGKPVSPGVYFYLIDAKGSDGIEYKKKGDINILE